MRHALRQDYKALLQPPTKQNLGGCLAILGSQRLEEGIVSARIANERRVGFEDNASLLAPVYYVWACEPGVELYLVDAEDAGVFGRLLL